ncbi:MAG TPA: glucose 1-dehydrogenase [Burkholderiaceae bacterium]|nr:glucose 1-dehydrogenase [Burkholderiaceae bacterium]
MDDLKGKVALVTGASTGIGAAVAREFGRLGMKVAVHYFSSADAAERVAADVREAGGEAFTLRADAHDSRAMRDVVARTAQHFGRLDVLVNNAGALVRRMPIEQFTDALFDDVVDLNVRSALAATAAATPIMRAQGGGNVIFVTSVAARHGGGPGASLYAGSKGFISTATHGLAKELAKDGIRVNAVSPGVITTPFHEKFSTPEQLETMRLTIPMARLGTADECVGAFVYFASERLSGYVTGQILEVNGGQYMP